MLRTVSIIALLALAGCGPGSLSVDSAIDADSTPNNSTTPNDGGTTPNNGGSPDMGTTPDPDTGSVGNDGGTVMPDTAVPCEESMCGTGASCVNNVCTCDDGLLGDPYQGCAAQNPCDGVDCPAGASCNPDGSCSCDPFFTGDGTSCEPTAPAADLSGRSVADVCDIWTSDYARTSGDFWMIEPLDDCDPGVLHPEEMRNALHRTSVYRMLVGLYPVSLAASQVENVQDCAMMHAAENVGLNHYPPESWACYTPAGDSGAGSSNLAQGLNNPASTVGLYIRDPGTPSLGHRRWIFNPSMGVTAFGHRGSYGCMYSFGGGRSHSVDYVAYPSPGPFPASALAGKWSISGGASYSGDDVVTITNLSDNSNVTVSDITAPSFGNLPSTLSWNANAPTGVDLQITIEDSGGQMLQQYTTRLVDCP